MNISEAVDRSILLCIAGSHAHGTATPASDVDIRGIFIAPQEYYIGLHRCEQVEDPDSDTVVYELKKYISLAVNANPNILEMLWMDKYIRLTPIGQKLIDNRELFLSKKVVHSFTGYAFAQLKRIKTHRSYLMGEVPQQPNPEDFGLDPSWKIGRDELNLFTSLAHSIGQEIEDELYRKAYSVEARGKINLDKEKIASSITDAILQHRREELSSMMQIDRQACEVLYRAKAYQNALKNWKKYRDWKENRNPARKKLEDKAGYDTKHASHLVRLLNMGYEIVTEGVLHVHRPYRDELLAIRNGAWTYEQVIEYAESMDKKVREAAAKSSLPKSPPISEIEKLQMELIEESWNA